MSHDIVVGDSLIDSSDPDSVDWDTLLDGVVDVKPDDICGLVDADPVHVEGQPCEDEGESFCIEEGSYAKFIPNFSMQCIRPGFVSCTVDPANATLSWQNFGCEKLLDNSGSDCGSLIGSVNCIQSGTASSCCPWTAQTYRAGSGVACSSDEIGQSRCGQGDNHKGGLLRTCNYLGQAQALYPKAPGSEGPSSDKCDYIFAECPYWYYSELCPKLERCYHPTACESGTNEYGEPTNVCARACIYDTDQGVARCAKTCDDLFKYYLD